MNDIPQFSARRTDDRLEIQHRLYQYCHGVDRLDFAQVREAYHADAYDDHGPYKGDVDGLIQWMHDRHPKIDLCLHYICNVLIDFTDQDSASCESYAICIHTYAAGASPFPSEDPESTIKSQTMLSSYRYVDHFTRREGRWRIQKRIVVNELINVQPTSTVGNVQIPMSLALGQRGRDDPSEILRSQLLQDSG